MKIIFLVFILPLAFASLEGIAYNTGTGMITFIGKHHPRVVLAGQRDDILMCGLDMEKAGCDVIHKIDVKHNDIQTLHVSIPHVNPVYACYTKFHRSHLLPLCLLKNFTVPKYGRQTRMDITLLPWKHFVRDNDRNGVRFWVSLSVLLVAVIGVLLWSE